MNLLEELDNTISKEFGMTLTEYRYVNVGGKFLYIEGHTGIDILGEKEIKFNLKKKKLSIKGENLIIKYFDTSTAIIQGKIIQVTTL